MAKEKKTLEEKLEEAIVKDGPYEVPENWVWTRLRCIGELVTGNTPSKNNDNYYGHEIPFIKPSDLNQGRYLNSSTEYLSDLGGTKARILPEGSTAVCCIGATIGKVAYLNASGATNQQINSIIPNNINSLYVYYYALSSQFKDNLIESSSSTTLPITNKSRMGELLIPIPPLKEQQRIVDRIESLFEKLDKAKELIEAAREGFEKRKAAVLEKAFRGELTQKWRIDNSVDYDITWNTKPFDCIAKVKSNLVEPSDYLRFPHIAPDNIEKKTGRLLEYRTIEEDGVKSPKHRFYPGQILYSKIRPYLSKVVLIDFEGLCSADMYPIETELDTKYLYYYMLSDKFVDNASNSGSRSVLPKINQKELGKISVPVCDIEEQKEIGSILDKLLEEEGKLDELTQLDDQIELIKKSILAKAYRGQLGTNCKEDESALELLKEMLSKL